MHEHGKKSREAIRTSALLADNLMCQSGADGTCQHHHDDLRREAMAMITAAAATADRLKPTDYHTIAFVYWVRAVGAYLAVTIDCFQCRLFLQQVQVQCLPQIMFKQEPGTQLSSFSVSSELSSLYLPVIRAHVLCCGINTNNKSCNLCLS